MLNPYEPPQTGSDSDRRTESPRDSAAKAAWALFAFALAAGLALVAHLSHMIQ